MSQQSSFYGYSYFSGANCFVKINGMPALEMAGISYQVQESTQPIYGYSSRIFDAVAIGQKIVRGNFVINFISPNYLARMIDVSRAKINVEAIATSYTKYKDIDNLVSESMDAKYLGEEQKFLQESLQEYKLLEIERKAEMQGFYNVTQAANELRRGSIEKVKDIETYREVISEEYDEKINEIIARYSDRLSEEEMNSYAFSEIGRSLSLPLDQNPMFDELEERLLKVSPGQSTDQVVATFMEDKRKEMAQRYAEQTIDDRFGEIDAAEKAFFRELNYIKADIEHERLTQEVQRKVELFGLQKYDETKAALAEERIEYDITIDTSVSAIEIYQSNLRNYRQSLEDENKSIIEKETQTRRDYEILIGQLRAAKTISSKKAIEAKLKALEDATNSYYASQEQANLVGLSRINDIGLLGPFNIDIQFAEEYTITIVDAFLTSRGSMIQIDENAIVEEYSFFARDIMYT